MRAYYATILIVGIVTLLAEESYRRMVLSEDNREQSQTRFDIPAYKFFLFIAIVTLILVSGLRYRVGTDYGQYAVNYWSYKLNVVQSIKELSEPGINVIAWMGSKIYDDSSSMFFLAAIITVGLFCITIVKNTKSFFFSFMLFIFLGCWHGSFNGVRQYLACAIIFAGHRFIIERKFLKYMIVVLLAACFHTTALVMVFPYFIATKRVRIINVVVTVIGAVAILYSYEFIFSLIGLYKGSEVDTSISYMSNSVNLLRIAVAVAPPVALAFMHKGVQFDSKQVFYMNMLIIHAAVMAATYNSTYLARIGIYTTVFTTIGLPEFIETSNLDKKLRTGFTLIILLLYAVFWYYEVSNSSSLNNFQWIWNRS